MSGKGPELPGQEMCERSLDNETVADLEDFDFDFDEEFEDVGDYGVEEDWTGA